MLDYTKPIFGQKKLILCGHRGDRTGDDENTMAAFKRAVASGCDMIETDLHRTKDGIIVLRHDSLIPGIGDIKDHTYKELKEIKPCLPTLGELAELAAEHPGLGLLIELKDVPASSPGGGKTKVTRPAPYSGRIPECSGTVRGPKKGKKALPGESAAVVDPGIAAADDALAKACADEAARILLGYGLGQRVWFLSFSGKILEYVYLRYGRAFHYHAFYPWFIMGDMSTDPAAFCEIACMQHRFLSEDGSVIRYEDPLCPESWWREVTSMRMVPIGAPSLATDENYKKAAEWGCGMINANDPERIKELLS